MAIKMRRDPTAAWAAANPTPESGEICYETDTKKLFIGDGTTAKNALQPFAFVMSAFQQTFQATTTQAAARSALGVGTGDSPQLAGIELGHATDTTLSRLSAGDVAVEGNRIYREGGADIPVADGGTGASTAADARTNLAVYSTAEVDALFTALKGGVSAAFDTLAEIETGLGTKADKTRTINSQTGTTYTLVLADAGKLVELSNAAAIALTVPPNSSVAFPVGTQIDLVQQGAGQVTVSPGSGVTIRSESSKVKLTGQYAAATLVKRAADEWYLVGNIAT